jgi:protein dithiol oxidoreductase (disulfide-forming)
MRLLWVLAGWMIATLLPTTGSAQQWVEGKHYFRIQPAVRTSVPPGKIEVAEAFSYGCPACASFHPLEKQLKAALPANAQYIYMHASFNSAESWPMFQRAYITAQAMGVADKAHDAMFDAIWKTGELAVADQKTQRLKNPQPTLEQVAKFYSRTAGIKAEEFLSVSKSFTVATAINRTEAWLRAARIDSTPTIVVNGKYRVTATSAGGVKELLALVDYLVKQEGGG